MFKYDKYNKFVGKTISELKEILYDKDSFVPVQKDNGNYKIRMSNVQNTLVSGENIKTINGNSILGSGNIEIEDLTYGIEDAPKNGNKYVRQDGEWVDESDYDDTELRNSIKALEDEVFPLSITVSGGGTFEKGTSLNILINWSVKKGNAVVQADSITINDETVSGTSKVFNNVTVTTTHTVKATYQLKTVSGSTKATFVAPMYFGFSATSNASELNITSLQKQAIKTTPNGSYSLNNSTTGHYLWLCVPDSMTINKVTSGGFDVPTELYQNGSTTVDNYKCYRSSSSINQGVMNIVIS